MCTKVFYAVMVVLALSGCDFKRGPRPVKPVTEKVQRHQQASLFPIFNEEDHDRSNGTVPLTVIINNLSSPDAPVVVGVFGPQNRFPDNNDKLKEYRIRPRNGKLIARIKDLNYGELAMAVYQDINEDGKIDKNLIGIPKEPFAFSNNYKPVIKAPSFRDCRFVYNANTNTINISLLKINSI